MPEAIHTHILLPISAIAAARPLMPHTHGMPYDAAQHGASIKPSAACSEVYDFDGGRFGTFAERHGIPTGTSIPRQALRLVNEAWSVDQAPVNPRSDVIAARNERRDALLDGAKSVIALEAINRFEAASSRLDIALRGLGEAIADAQADQAKRAA